jgi:hypothetical protein
MHNQCIPRLGILRLRKEPRVSRVSLLSERLSVTHSHRSPEAVLRVEVSLLTTTAHATPPLARRVAPRPGEVGLRGGGQERPRTQRQPGAAQVEVMGFLDLATHHRCARCVAPHPGEAGLRGEGGRGGRGGGRSYPAQNTTPTAESKRRRRWRVEKAVRPVVVPWHLLGFEAEH